MNRVDIVKKMHAENDLTKEEARLLVDIVFDQISNTLANGDRVEIRGFCSFHVKKYGAYTGYNPKRGKKVKVKAKKLPFFRAGMELKRRVNR